MFMPRKLISTIASVLLVLVIASGTGYAANDLQRIVFTMATANPVVGDYVFVYAVPHALGYFEEEGLDVVLQTSDGSNVSAQLLLSGSTDFITTAPESAMLVREQGGDIISVFSLRKKGGYGIATLEGSDIKELADLRGKRIAVASLGSAALGIIERSLADIGIDRSEYEFIATGTGAPAATALVTGRVDALGMWNTIYASIENMGTKLDQIELPILDHLPGTSIFTTERYASENPEIVGGFCRAIAKGLTFTTHELERAIEIFYEVFPSAKPLGVSHDEMIRQASHIMRMELDRIFDGPESPLGYNFPERWEFARHAYVDLGLVQNPRPAEEHYTNDFLDVCNDFDMPPITW